MKKILIIAGSDSGGGAGIQADIKTASAHGIFATTAITALTAQNTLGVQGVLDTNPEFVAQQIKSVFDDIGADVVKIGMLSNAKIIEAIAAQLQNYITAQPIVLDTVMIAKGGAALLQADAVAALRTKLIPLAFLVTPNLPEAEELAGMKINNADYMVAAAKKIQALGVKNILIKGGHLEGDEVTDTLLIGGKIHIFKSPRIKTKNTHGTGCTLASSIACNLALGADLKEAVAKAREYVFEAIRTAPEIGAGHGPLNHLLQRQLSVG